MSEDRAKLARLSPIGQHVHLHLFGDDSEPRLLCEVLNIYNNLLAVQEIKDDGTYGDILWVPCSQAVMVVVAEAD